MSRLALLTTLCIIALATPVIGETIQPAIISETAVAEPALTEPAPSKPDNAQPSEPAVNSVQENSVQDIGATAADTIEHPDTDDEDETFEICDPLAPVNEAMFHFNDKLYYWGLKPVTLAYSYVMPEFARIGFNNFFSNLRSPVNIVNNLLQFEISRSFLELLRLIFNSVVGVGGFFDASSALLGIDKQEADFGQTLGLYGIGQGCYLVLPVVGPTSFRDGIGLTGDMFMSPPTYLGYFFLTFWEASGAYLYEKVNDTSFKIGDYEQFMSMSLDPYQAQKNAFVQYRRKKVKDAVDR